MADNIYLGHLDTIQLIATSTDFLCCFRQWCRSCVLQETKGKITLGSLCEKCVNKFHRCVCEGGGGEVN